MDFVSIDAFDYLLPDEQIAKFPLADRDTSKLLHCKEGSISTYQFSDLPQLLPQNTLLVLNDTRVVPARLLFQKSTGAIIEIMLLSPMQPSPIVSVAMETTETGVWECLIGNKKRWKQGETLRLSFQAADTTFEVEASWENREANLVAFTWKNTSATALTFAELVTHIGNLPLPPYLNRSAELTDYQAYQTIYAAAAGAVAAPTAGLHFTPKVQAELAEQGIRSAYVTLHVGAGTFLPVKTANALEHTMHAEQVVFTKDLIASVRDAADQVVAVGTTSVRALESLYWVGVQLLESLSEVAVAAPNFFVSQFYPYQPFQALPTVEASLTAVLEFMEKHSLSHIIGETQILIYPSYQFRVVDGLITNFHQPKSTLLLLVAALIGSAWKEVYDYALQQNFRFLSYGDSSLLWKKVLPN